MATTATVTSVAERSTKQSGRQGYRLGVRLADGRDVEANVYLRRRPQPGQQVEVRHMPNDPAWLEVVEPA